MNAVTKTEAEVAKFNRAGANIFLNTSSEPMPRLPAETFTVEQMPMGGPMFFAKMPDLKCTGRMYGDIETRAARVMTTFDGRPGSTGVLLTGEKGSGKTLLARMLSQQCRERKGMPTIMVNKPFSGDALMHLLGELNQPYMLFIDEFEKIYGGPKGENDAQNSLLTLFDGASTAHRLVVVTVNDMFRVSSFLKNRPGRFYYQMTYHGLDEAFIRDYCDVNLVNKDDADGVVTVSMLFEAFNFDMLQALVEEMNRYNEPAKEAIKYLNVVPSTDSFHWDFEEVAPTDEYRAEWVGLMTKHSGYVSKIKERLGKDIAMEEVEFTIKGDTLRTGAVSPMQDGQDVYVKIMANGHEMDVRCIEFGTDDVLSMTGGTLTYETEEFGVIKLKRRPTRTYHYGSLL